MVSSILLRILNGDPIIRSNRRRVSAVEGGYRRETKGLGMTGRGYVEIGSDVLLELQVEVSLGAKKKKSASALTRSENSCHVLYRVNVKERLLFQYYRKRTRST